MPMPPSWLSSPVISRPNTFDPVLAVLRREAADGFDHRRNGRGQPVERAQKAQENQQVDDIARDVPRLVDPGRDRIRGSSGEDDAEICIRAPRERSSVASGARRRGGLTNSCLDFRAVKPSIQLTERISWITCQKQAITPITKTSSDEPVQPGVRQEHRRHAGEGDIGAERRPAPDAISISAIWRTGCENWATLAVRLTHASACPGPVHVAAQHRASRRNVQCTKRLCCDHATAAPQRCSAHPRRPAIPARRPNPQLAPDAPRC